MKTLLAFVVLASLAGGCTTSSTKEPAARLDPRPAGTETGTSFPGVNQGTTDTTATRSNDTYH